MFPYIGETAENLTGGAGRGGWEHAHPPSSRRLPLAAGGLPDGGSRAAGRRPAAPAVAAGVRAAAVAPSERRGGSRRSGPQPDRPACRRAEPALSPGRRPSFVARLAATPPALETPPPT